MIRPNSAHHTMHAPGRTPCTTTHIRRAVQSTASRLTRIHAKGALSAGMEIDHGCHAVGTTATTDRPAYVARISMGGGDSMAQRRDGPMKLVGPHQSTPGYLERCPRCPRCHPVTRS